MARILHETVRDELRRRVAAEEYKSGNALPSARALAGDLSVSDIRVKRALRDLQTAGVLRSVQGLGTFVRERPRFIRDLDFSFNSLEDAHRVSASIRLLSAHQEAICDPHLGSLPPPSGPMFAVRKLILVDGMAGMYDTSYVPILLDDVLVGAFAHELVMDVLAVGGVPSTGTRMLIDAAPALKNLQEVFGLPHGYPTLRRLYRLEKTDPGFSVVGIAESPFDRLACSIELEGPARTGGHKRGKARNTAPVHSTAKISKRSKEASGCCPHRHPQTFL